MVGDVNVQQHVTVVWQFAQALCMTGRHVQISQPFITRVWPVRGLVTAIGFNGDAFCKFELSVGVSLQWRVSILEPSSAFCNEIDRRRRLLTHAQPVKTSYRVNHTIVYYSFFFFLQHNNISQSSLLLR